MGSVDNERAQHALSFGEGFVDISMYVALAGRSKNSACTKVRQSAPHIPKTSAGRFRPNLPITDRPRQPPGWHEGLVSHFAVPNVWYREQDCGSRG